MRKYVKLLFYIFLLKASCFAELTDSSSRPNILWIIADDYSPDAGCYGDTLVQTPNLNRLASEGRMYTNAYATSPVCSSSRSAIYTGLYQTSTGTHQHRTFNKQSLPEGVLAITEYFKEAGYYTTNANFGPLPYPPGKTDFNFESETEVFDGADWSERAEGQPFFASIQIAEPHRPFTQDVSDPVDPALVELPPYYPDHPIVRKDWANYLEAVQMMDQKLGQILRRLEEDGLAENTIVFFFADQGRPQLRAKQWLYDSGLRVPLIVRWPGNIEPNSFSRELVSLIDLAPASLSAAKIPVPELMHGRDFLNSSLKPRDYIYAARDRTDAVVDRIRAVRDDRYKYIRNYMPERPYNQFGHYKTFFYPALTVLNVMHARGDLSSVEALFMAESKPVEELYDTAVDPYEVNNLAADPNYRVQLAELRQALDAWKLETKDVGDLDPDDDREALLERRWEKYRHLWKSRGIEDPRRIDWEDYLGMWYEELGLGSPWKNGDSSVSPFSSVWKFEEFENDEAFLESSGFRSEIYRVVDAYQLRIWHLAPKTGDEVTNQSAIVFFYGGGWQKRNILHFKRQAQALADLGMHAFLADYRAEYIYGGTPFDCVEDAKDAIRFVRAHAARWGVASDKIAAAGGSAGGHLAAAAALLPCLETTSELENSCRPDALVLFNPVYDNSESGYGYERVKENWKAISPLEHISGEAPPNIVFLGDMDRYIPVETAEMWRDRMLEAGVFSELFIYAGRPHGFFKTGEDYADTLSRTIAFLRSIGFIQ